MAQKFKMKKNGLQNIRHVGLCLFRLNLNLIYSSYLLVFLFISMVVVLWHVTSLHIEKEMVSNPCPWPSPNIVSILPDTSYAFPTTGYPRQRYSGIPLTNDQKSPGKGLLWTIYEHLTFHGTRLKTAPRIEANGERLNGAGGIKVKVRIEVCGASVKSLEASVSDLNTAYDTSWDLCH